MDGLFAFCSTRNSTFVISHLRFSSSDLSKYFLVPHNLYCFRWHPLPGFDCPRRHFRGRPGMVGKEGSGGGRRQARIWFALQGDQARYRKDANDLYPLQVPLQWYADRWNRIR